MWVCLFTIFHISSAAVTEARSEVYYLRHCQTHFFCKVKSHLTIIWNNPELILKCLIRIPSLRHRSPCCSKGHLSSAETACVPRPAKIPHDNPPQLVAQLKITSTQSPPPPPSPTQVVSHRLTQPQRKQLEGERNWLINNVLQYAPTIHNWCLYLRPGVSRFNWHCTTQIHVIKDKV